MRQQQGGGAFPMSQTPRVQFSLDFDPGLTEQFRSLHEVLAATVYGSRIGLSGVAAHCDLSPSALSRMLNSNPDDPRHLPVDLLTKIMEATGDLKPIHWLVAKFVPDEKMRQHLAVSQLQAVLPTILNALSSLGLNKEKR
jgi:hypothetical protein